MWPIARKRNPVAGSESNRHRFRIFSPACLPNSSVSAPIFEAATPQSLIRGCSPAATQAGILIHKPCNCDWAISASTPVGARIAALRGLASEMPPPVVADLLGYSYTCVDQHAEAAASPWSRSVT